MAQSVRWKVQDSDGHDVYLTEERWQHIIEPFNHPEMEGYEDELKLTIQRGQRREDPLDPQKYRYTSGFDNLVEDNTHIVAIVLFRFRHDGGGRPNPNNYVVTAYQKKELREPWRSR